MVRHPGSICHLLVIVGPCRGVARYRARVVVLLALEEVGAHALRRHVGIVRSSIRICVLLGSRKRRCGCVGRDVRLRRAAVRVIVGRRLGSIGERVNGRGCRPRSVQAWDLEREMQRRLVLDRLGSPGW